MTSDSRVVEFLNVGGGVGLVGVAAGGIRRAERVGDVLHVDPGIGDRLEGVRVDRAMVVTRLGFGGLLAFALMLMAFFLHRQWLDALGEFDDGRLAGAGFDEALQETLEMQAVDQHHVRACHRHGIGGFRLVNMRIAIRADQRSQRNAVAADILGKVFDDREAGDDLQRLGGAGRRGKGG